MNELEHLGLLKFDFLGLRTLTDIHEAVKYIKEIHGVEIDFTKMSYDDPAVFELISSGNTEAVFQLESGGMKKFMMDLQPSSLEDIIAGISLYRPGPMDFIPKFIKGKREPEKIEYEDPCLEPILGTTYGCIIYQEQVMKIFQVMAGFSLGGADNVRRIMSKKKPEKLPPEKKKFIHGWKDPLGQKKDIPGAIALGHDEKVAEKVFDRSGAGCDYDFIGWPASGSFPAQLFNGGTAWSVTLNPTAYQTAVKSALTVTLTRESDGRTWTFSSRGSDGFFNVTSSGYGEGYCVIFRPEGVDDYMGTYTVRIEGLKALNGQDVEDFTYQVDFFGSKTTNQDSTAAEQPEQAGTGTQGGSSQTAGAAFRDVPAAHWASAAIKAAVEQGFVNGYADGTFRPADPVTNAHFNAMLSRAFYPADLKSAKSGASWWTPNVTVNDAHGILDGTDLKQAELAEGVWSAEINAPISRCDMAQMMYNILLDKGAPLPSAAECQAAQSRMGDWSRIPARYQEAVSTCYALGRLNGQKDGTFGGSSSMNRAQGCTVISRLLDYIA